MSSIDRDFARMEGGDEGVTGVDAVIAPPASPQSRLAALLERPILSLATAAPDRPVIEIDGVGYRLRFYDDMPFAEHGRLTLLTQRVEELAKVAIDDRALELSPDEAIRLGEEMDGCYNEMLRLVLPTCPAEIIALLGYQQKRGVMEAFRLALATFRAVARAGAATDRPTGVSSSPPSPPATAGRGGTGSRKRRSATSSPPTAP
jgi:hypothetical protein